MKAIDFLNNTVSKWEQFTAMQEFYQDEELAYAENEVRKARALMEARTKCDLMILGVPGDLANRLSIGASRQIQVLRHAKRPRVVYKLMSNNIIVPITFSLVARDDGSNSISMPTEFEGFGYYREVPYFNIYTFDEDGDVDGMREDPFLIFYDFTLDRTTHNYDIESIEFAIGFARKRFLDFKKDMFDEWKKGSEKFNE